MSEVTSSILRETFGYAQFRGAQQSIVDHVVDGGDALVLPDQGSPVLTRELVYTGITRAKRWFTLVGGARAQGPVLAEAIGRRFLRASGLMA